MPVLLRILLLVALVLSFGQKVSAAPISTTLEIDHGAHSIMARMKQGQSLESAHEAQRENDQQTCCPGKALSCCLAGLALAINPVEPAKSGYLRSKQALPLAYLPPGQIVAPLLDPPRSALL